MSTKTLSLILLGLILMLIYFLPINTLSLENYSIACLHQRILGFGCPGCGMTRAMHAFMHFNFHEAANLNFAVFGLFPLLIFQSTFQVLGSINVKMIQRIAMVIFLLLLSLQYAFRIFEIT